MTGIVQDLLELSRLESSDRDAAVRADRRRRADGAAAPGRARAHAQHPAQVQVRADSNAMLLGEEMQIHSAFANLVDNAAKYTPADGSVQMRWWTDEQGGHFSVTDTGIGIAPEHIPRLTERFYRVDAGRSRATGGSGLGLAIVKHVLQRHGAQLVDRERGGARQQVHLPLSARAAAAPVKESAASGAASVLAGMRATHSSKLRSACACEAIVALYWQHAYSARSSNSIEAAHGSR